MQEAFFLADQLQVEFAYLYFSGSGDSGDLQDVLLYVKADEEYSLFAESEAANEDGKWVRKVNPLWTPDHTRLVKLLETLFDSELSDKIGWDWYNNEGGGGTCEINFPTGDVGISGHFYSMEEHSADGCSFNIFGEEK